MFCASHADRCLDPRRRVLFLISKHKILDAISIYTGVYAYVNIVCLPRGGPSRPWLDATVTRVTSVYHLVSGV